MLAKLPLPRSVNFPSAAGLPALPRRYVAVAIICFLILATLYTSDVSVRDIPFHPASRPPKPYVPKPKPEDGRFAWEELPVRHPVDSLRTLPTKRPKSLPRIQHKFKKKTFAEEEVQTVRRAHVKDAFEKCWRAYKAKAWLADELAPLTGQAKNPFGGWAATLVDSLDTLWIMDLREEFDEAVDALQEIDFSRSSQAEVNVFETTIRYLGGFLGAFDLSGDQRLLDKAVEMGEMLYVAFDTPNRMPVTRWNSENAKTKPQVASSSAFMAEVGSLSLEFTRLSQLTQDMKWFDAVQRITEIFARDQSSTQLPGMFPLGINTQEGNFTQGGTFSIGAMGDSTYEYFPKMYALLGGRAPEYQTLYQDSMDTAMHNLFFRPVIPEKTEILVPGIVNINKEGKPELEPQGQHLACFAGGMLALGSRLFKNTTHLEYATKLTDGCLWAYRSLPLGLMPEMFHLVQCDKKDVCPWDAAKWQAHVMRDAPYEKKGQPTRQLIASERLPPGFVSIQDRRYWLRPEAIESVFVLYRITGRRELLEAAWEMWLAIEKHAETDLAFAGVLDVTVEETPPQADVMESYWMAETLKYFYLMFSDPDVISLDEYVLNTEAHPFRRPL